MNNELTKVSLIDLSDMLNKAYLESNQEKINVIASEIARRLYVPNPSITFEEFKKNFGYKPLEEEKAKMMVKKIELYEE